MTEWFQRAFGATVDEARAAIADARAKIIDESWFERKTPEPQRQNDLGWSRADHPAPSEPNSPSHERDRGIDR